MIPHDIVLHSAGSVSVAVLALIMAIFQIILFLRKPEFKWYGWGASISLLGMLYGIGIFLEYNTPAGPLNRFAGLLEFTAIIFLIHCIYGFSFSYLELAAKRYLIAAGIFHGLVLILLWFTDGIVSDRFVTRNLVGLAKPYIEPDLGPLGPLFVLYGVSASIGVIVLWVRRKKSDLRHRTAFLAGMIFWLVLATHDGLVSMGLRSTPYLMEYGLLGFTMVVLWVVFSGYSDRSALDKYRMITEVANDGIVMVQDGRAVFANPACVALIGAPVVGWSIENFLDVVAPKDRVLLRTYYEDLLAAKDMPESLIIGLKRKDETERVVEIRAKPVRYKNKAAILAALRDMTQRIREEQALKKSEAQVARLKKMESLGLLAGGVAHDLNNVLSGIVSYPELILLDLPPDSKFRKPLQTIQNSGQRAVAIVQDLLTVARGVAVGKAPLNINDIVREYMNSPEFTKLLEFHPAVSLRENLNDHLLNIKGSAFHIRKTVMNLVSNAAEAMDDGGQIVVSTMNRYLDRPLQGYQDIPEGEYAVLIVEDSGPGISPEDLQRIFEPFFTKKVMGRSGTGLGLTLTWNVVQDHRGYIDVTSDPGGTRFTLYFPITREAMVDKAPAVDPEKLKGNGETILVVDDMESQREISCRMLEKLGYTPTAVAGGEAALDYLKDHCVDLLLLDMIMDPGIDGRETYALIKQIHPQQKAVIVSGFAETDQVAETLRLGAGEFIKKPLILETLGQALKRELKRPPAN
ncbi:MAG: ATP-binding protein [Desulfobacterales bacterium]